MRFSSILEAKIGLPLKLSAIGISAHRINSYVIQPRFAENLPMTNRNPSVTKPVYRAMGYAATSLCAHISGYRLQAHSPSLSEAFLVAALWVTSIPFFSAYANSYHVEDPLGQDNEEASKWAKSSAGVLARILVVLGTPLLIAIYIARENKWPSVSYFVVLLIFAALFNIYGWYTVRQAVSGPAKMRHQLVWPVIFSIALPLYSGIIFSDQQNEFLTFAPVACLFLYFLISLRLSRTIFIYSGLAILVSLIIRRIAGYDGYLVHFSIMAFYLCIAAYLAVFEAWGITASLALKEYIAARGQDSSPDPYLPQGSRYYLATFIALSVATLTLPMVYMFSDYGKLFFWGSAVHGLGAFLAWFWAGGALRRLREHRDAWLIGKTIAGFFFLIIVLVGDVVFQTLPMKRILINMKALSALTGTLTLSLLAILAQYRKDKEHFKREQGGEYELLDHWAPRLLMSRSGILVITIILSLLLAFGTFVIAELQPELSTIVFKSDRVYFFYLASALLSSILMIFKGGARITMLPVLGLIMSARWFTSTMIGLAVFLPALQSSPTVLNALLSALPFFFASAGGFLLNDACDYERDTISKPFRPLPRGLVGRQTVYFAGIFSILCALGITSLGDQSTLGLTLQLSAIVGVVTYNLLTAKVGWLKGPFTALLCMLPLIFVLDAYRYPSSFWWIIVAGYTFFVGRELLMDILDLKGDRETGLNTLPMIIGIRRSEFLALLLVGISAAALLFFRHASEVLLHQREIDLALVGLAVLGFAWWKIHVSHYKRQVIRLSWLPMILALATFLG